MARLTYGSTIADQPIGCPAWVTVCTTMSRPAGPAKEMCTVPEASRKKAVAGSPSVKIRVPASTSTMRACLASSARSWGSNPSKNGESASSWSCAALTA